MVKKRSGVCEYCGKEYTGYGSKYCSVECSSKRRIGTKVPFRPYKERVFKLCGYCGKEMQLTPYQATFKRFCCRDCGNKSRRRKVLRNCLACNKAFHVEMSRVGEGRGKYCSKLCYGKDTATKITIICEQCGKQFQAWPSNTKGDNGKYCSKKCFGIATRNRVKRICKNCAKPFEVKVFTVDQGEGLYCSRRCALASRGETYIEKLVREELENRGINHEQEKPIGRWVADFYLPDHIIVIEADGDYWHGLEKAKKTAQRKDQHLMNKGIKVFRLKESEIKSDVSVLIDQVLKGVNDGYDCRSSKLF